MLRAGDVGAGDVGAGDVGAGDVGAGQAVKALNNMVSTGGFLIGIEALLVGQRFGLDAGVACRGRSVRSFVRPRRPCC